MIIILFTVLYVPKLNFSFLNVFDKLEARVLILLTIYFVGIYDPLIALLLSVCYIRTYKTS